MAKWTDLKGAVAEVIKTNGNQEITGQVLQNVLNTIISNLGENATYAGIAIPTTNPGTPDGPVFYFAFQPGTYSNFNANVISERDNMRIFYWNGTGWHDEDTGVPNSSMLSSYVNNVAMGTINVNISGGYSELDSYNSYDKKGWYCLSNNGALPGTHLLVTGDDWGHVVHQFLFGDYVLDEEGDISGHNDGQPSILIRTYNINSSTITDPAKGTWSKWRQFPEIMQTTGDSQTSVMSQAGVTKYIENVAMGTINVNIGGDYSELDSYNSYDKKGLYCLSSGGELPGTHLLVTGDDWGHVVHQFLFGDYVINEEGEITGHQDGTPSILIRTYNINSSTISDPAIGTWSKWKQFIEIMQTTGDSQTSVMSQAATTKAFNSVDNKMRASNFALFSDGNHSDDMNKLVKEVYIKKRDGYETTNYVVLELYRRNMVNKVPTPGIMQIAFYERAADGSEIKNSYASWKWNLSNYAGGYLTEKDGVFTSVGSFRNNYTIQLVVDPSALPDEEVEYHWEKSKLNLLAYDKNNSPHIAMSELFTINAGKANIAITKTRIDIPDTGENNNKKFSLGQSVLVDSLIYDVTDFIPVVAGSLLWIKQTGGGLRCAWYDSNKAPLNGLAEANLSSNGTFVEIPENCAYLALYKNNHSNPSNIITYVYEIYRITAGVVTKDGETVAFNLGNFFLRSHFQNFFYNLTNKEGFLTSNSTTNFARFVEKKTPVEISYTGVMDNKYIKEDGSIGKSSSWDLTDYVPVPDGGGKTIVIEQAPPYAHVFAAFKSDKTALGRIVQYKPVAKKVIVLPQDTEFIIMYKRKKSVTPNQEYNYTAYLTENSLQNADGTKSYNLDEMGLSQEALDQIKTYVDGLIAPMQAQIDSATQAANAATSAAAGAQGALQANQNKFDQLENEISQIAPNPVEPYYLPRPSNGVVNFQVPVNCANADVDDRTLQNQDVINIHYDWGVLLLPTNYSQTGKPVRLVIACHGTGGWINGSTISTTHSSMLLSQGYAVMDMNGIPATFAGSTDGSDSGKRHYGAPFVLNSYVNGYRYVIEKYNIAKDGCFVYGISMGGLSSFMLVLSGVIPVIAQGGFCPCIDLYKQAYVNPWNAANIQRADIASYFGFTGTAPTWTTQRPPSIAERDYFLNNSSKWLGYNSMTKQVPNVDIHELYDYIPATSSVEDATEQASFDKFCRIHPVPLKIWHNYDDSTVRWRYSKYFCEMVRRAGGLAFLRTFPSGGHNAWFNGDVVPNVNTIDGDTISMKASIYEMIQWFKRFDR